MPDSPKSPIATFAPGKVLATQAPSLAFGLLVAAGALIAAFAVLSSDGITPRSRIAAPLMLMFFGAASVGIFGRGLVDAGRSGPAVEIRGGRLRAFTVGFAEMPVSEISHVRVVGRGRSRRVVVYGSAGPRLVIRADIMSPDARTIAHAIMKAAKPAEAAGRLLRPGGGERSGKAGKRPSAVSARAHYGAPPGPPEGRA